MHLANETNLVDDDDEAHYVDVHFCFSFWPPPFIPVVSPPVD